MTNKKFLAVLCFLLSLPTLACNDVFKALTDLDQLRTEKREFKEQLSSYIDSLHVNNHGLSKEAFDSTVYYYQFHETLPGFPEISKNAKAVVLAFGGAGPHTSTGKTFMQYGRAFGKKGISIISIDYPFHGDGRGPRRNEFRNRERFLRSIYQFINHYKAANLPVYFMGHSFGSILIHELLWRSPNIARGAMLASPGGNMTPGMSEIYERLINDDFFTETLGREEVHEDSLAGEWSEMMEHQFESLGQRRMRTNIPVVVMAGDQDYWSTPAIIENLSRYYANSEFTIVPGAGHVDIWKHKRDVDSIMVERMTDIIEEDLGHELEIQNEPLSSSIDKIKAHYQMVSLFRNWFHETHTRALETYTVEEARSQELLHEWDVYMTSFLLRKLNQLIHDARTFVLSRADFPKIERALERYQEALEDFPRLVGRYENNEVKDYPRTPIIPEPDQRMIINFLLDYY